eukprot:TRINITY_DN4493_c0_g2_i1.p1 TRINITY_DN4493_c0_g2~~TRINITY_DN4493_c0_g2_i1.p1  ORF type:complete len:174 (-),score=67.45 TRINITY_DN4493_c0_g2_i1:10-483(-)
MSETNGTIAKLKRELEEEKRKRKNFEEYENLRKKISELPSRSETETDMARLKEDLDALEAESSALDAKIELRTKQFQLLLFAIEELSNLQDDEIPVANVSTDVEKPVYKSSNKKRPHSSSSSGSSSSSRSRESETKKRVISTPSTGTPATTTVPMEE